MPQNGHSKVGYGASVHLYVCSSTTQIDSWTCVRIRTKAPSTDLLAKPLLHYIMISHSLPHISAFKNNKFPMNG